MSSSPSDRNPVEVLAEEFVARHRRGERPPLTEYTTRYPEWADEIRDLFPALVVIEQLKPGGAEATGDFASATVAETKAPERLGDYRILREVGRGGMGVVYEAEQVSLGRRVALKVFALPSLANPIYLERFRRESRAAAKLHHSNIVPVFGVGECDGHHYYAMEFIQGAPLDKVLDDVRRLRGEPAPPAVRTDAVAIDLSFSVADGLVNSSFGEHAPLTTATVVASGQVPEHTGADRISDSSGGSLAASRTGWEYWRNVARIGVQVADALAYAHKQGVLHRDIKPSNLILDLQGTAWITDFGLAKAEGVGDLTQAGDIVGTLRFMAPERFSGASSLSSDIYGLGVTLYEMITLRPAFEDSLRERLISRIVADPPVRPRKLNAAIPRDLETIVLKALAKEPADRYATAEQMAEDLRRFLADRPIKARPSSTAEKMVRWSRRNPALAALTGAVALLLLVVAVGASVSSFQLRAALDQSEKNRDQSEKNRVRAEQAKTEAKDRLWASLLAQARANRLSRRLGQRYETLKTLTEAAELARARGMSEDHFLQLRNEAVACLTLPDMRIVKEWPGYPIGGSHVDFDASLERYARTDVHGGISVRRVTDDTEIARMPATGLQESWSSLSPDGRFLAAGSWNGVRGWRVDGKEPSLLWEIPRLSWAVSPDWHLMASMRPGTSVLELFDPASGKLQRKLKVNRSSDQMAFHPGGTTIAIGCTSTVELRDLDTGRLLAELPHTSRPGFLAWHPAGKCLAVAGTDRIIHLWDVPAKKEVLRLEGIKSDGEVIAFNHSGDLLAGNGWEGVLRLWDTMTGKLLFSARSSWVATPRFSPDDRRLACDSTAGKIRIWEVDPVREYRTLVRDPVLGAGYYYNFAVHPNGRLLAVGMLDGVGLWDLDSNRNLDFLRLGTTYYVLFEPSGSLLTYSTSGLRRWPVRTDESMPGRQRIGPSERLPVSGSDVGIGQSRDGRVLALARHDGAIVLSQDRPGSPLLLFHPGDDVRGVAVSPDGRWVVTGPHNFTTNKVWDAHSGKLVKELPLEARGAAFSPDGKSMATGGDVMQLWQVGDWQKGQPIPGAGPSSIFNYSPDGKILAVETGFGSVRLLDPETGREYARLEDPNQDPGTFPQFSPDGSRLVLSSQQGQCIHVWDLRAIRRQLAELGLDWDLPPYPPEVEHGTTTPLEVVVDTTSVGIPSFDPQGAQAQLALYSLAAALNPINPEAYFQCGRIHLTVKQWREAAEDFGRCLLFVQSARAHALRATAYWELHEYARAQADLDQAVAIAPKVPWTASEYNNFAWFYATAPASIRQPKKALPLAKKAAELQPNWVIMNTLGVVYYRLGRFEEARQALEKGVQLNGGSPTAFDAYFLSMIHARQGSAEKAKAFFDMAGRWRKQPTIPLTPNQIQELDDFRAEAKSLVRPN